MMWFKKQPEAKEPKIRSRRAKPPQPRKPRRGKLYAAVAVLALVASAAAVATAQPASHLGAVRGRLLGWTASQGGLAIAEIEISGLRKVTRTEALAALEAEEGAPILALDLEAARARLEALPFIRHARVERRLPGLVSVALVERDALAVWQHEGRFELIDADGARLAEAARPDAWGKLPIVVGGERAAQAVPAGAEGEARTVIATRPPPETAGFLAALEARPALAGAVQAVMRRGGRRWDVLLTGGTRAKLPEGDEAAALDQLAAMVAEDGLLDKAPVAVDLRQPGRVVVQTAEEGPLRAGIDDKPGKEL